MHEWKFDLRSATAGPLFRGRSLGSWLPFSFLCIGDDVTHFCYWDYLLGSAESECIRRMVTAKERLWKIGRTKESIYLTTGLATRL